MTYSHGHNAITGAPGVDQEPDRMREAAAVAADVAGELRDLRDRLDAVGLLGPQGAGPKLRKRLEVSAQRLDEIARNLRRRLVQLEPSADTRGTS